MKQILTLITCLLFTGLAYGQKQEPILDSMQINIARNNIEIINIKSAMNKHNRQYFTGIGVCVGGAVLSAVGSFIYANSFTTTQVVFGSNTRQIVTTNNSQKMIGLSSMILGYGLAATGLVITIDSHKYFKIRK